MKVKISLTFLLLLSFYGADGQTKNYYSVDSLLVQGEYSKTVDLCNSILERDSLNPEVYYKMGLAYQNLMLSDKSSSSFIKAVKLAPENKKYILSLGKYYYNSGKIKQALPIFTILCNADSLNWVYSYFLSDIYMQKGLYKKAMVIYKRFYNQDTTNLMFLDKIGFCSLKMGQLDTARKIFEKSLLLNSKNIPALKNLSYIYLKKDMVDTAIYLLNKGIEYDSTDMDLYSRRANILYLQNLQYRAGADYLRILESGDSSKIVLKRIGIGLAYNNQHLEALKYLLAAYQSDSNDFEVSSYLGQTYYKLKSYKKSIKYYNRVLKLVEPISKQTDYTYMLLADTYRDSNLYDEAAKYYTKSLSNKYNARICMTIANIYDEKIKNFDKAISYYQLFLNNLDKNEFALDTAYVEKVKNRLNWLIENRNRKKLKSGK